MNRSAGTFAFVVLVVSSCPRAAAQTEDTRFQLGVHVAGAVSSEFDKTDLGVGGRFSWHPMPLLGAEAEFNLYPSDFADEPAFSSSRVEGLFGVTIGPRVGPFRPFAKLRPGFVRFSDPPEPFACILIFPPPLACALPGETVFAVDIGGGIEFFPTERAFGRLDIGDRVLRYPGPAFDRDRNVHEDAFLSHDLRFQVGGGIRF